MNNQIEVQAFGEVDAEGNLKIYNAANFKTNCDIFFKGKKIILLAYEKKTPVTNLQKAGYFGVILPQVVNAFKEIGHNEITKEAADTYLRQMFLFNEIFEDGEIVENEIKSLKEDDNEVSTKEFAEFWEKIVLFCAENMDCEIKLPVKQQ